MTPHAAGHVPAPAREVPMTGGTPSRAATHPEEDMGRPTVRTPSGLRLADWFRQQHDALDRAMDECATDTRHYLSGQLKVLDRVQEHVMREVAYAEVEAIAIVASGSTLAAADQWLSDATKGGAIDIEAA